MAQKFDFQLSAKQYVDLALEKHRNGDDASSARYARKAIQANKKYLPAYGVLSFLFADNNEYELANKTLFIGMNEAGNWEEPNARRQLAHNYMQLDMFDVAMYYADNVDADLYDALDSAMEMQETTPDFYLSYPRGEEYYGRLMAKAFETASQGDPETALKMLETVASEAGDFGEQANEAKLILYTMKNDADGVIAFGEEMLEKGSANTAIRCTLASAYCMKNREKEARDVMTPLFELENPDLETTFMMLPIAVNLNLHAEVVRLINRAIKLGKHNSMRLMLWLSQALYNAGHRDEARRVMAEVRDFYGEESPAEYYLKLYADKPEKVEYSLTLPHEGGTRNLDAVRDIMTMSEEEIDEFERTHTKPCDNLEYYSNWAFINGNRNLQHGLLARIIFDRRAHRLIENALITGELRYEVASMLIFALFHLNDDMHPVEFNVVAQDRFKHIKFFLPRAFKHMPSVLQTAVQLSMADIIFTDEEPNLYLGKFVSLVNSIVDIGLDGKLIYSTKQREKLPGVRSADTLVGVLLGKVYEEDEPREAVLSRYGLNPRLFDKYYNIVFGEDND